MYLSMGKVNGYAMEKVVRGCREHYRKHYREEADTALVSTRMENPPDEIDGLPVAVMR